MRAQCLPLFLQGGWGGQLGLLGGAVPIVFQLLIRGNVTSRTRQNRSQSDAPGPKTDLRTNSLQPERPDSNGPGPWGPAPLGKSGVSVPWRSVPWRSGLQRALLSVSSAQKCSGAWRLATPSGVSRAARLAVSCRSPASGHRACRSKYTRDQSRETGSLSRPPGGLGAPAKRILLGSAWADSGSLVFLRDDVGLRTVVSNRRLLR